MAKARKTYRKIITTPELIEQINPKNKQLVDRYLKNFATKRSPKSVVVYKSNLDIFFVWCVLYADNIFFVDLKKLDLMDFFDFCVTELKYSPNRYAQMHSCLSSFSTWIENYYDDDYPEYRNLLPKIEKLPKEAVRKKSVFSMEEINSLLDKLGSEGRVQEQCLLALLISSGARASELSRFTIDIVDENNTAFDDLFLETTDTIQVKGRGVNGKSLIRYILKDTFLPYYHKWLPTRKEIMEKYNKNHNAIFINQFGEPASVATFRGWVERWSESMDKPLYLHSLRHLYCTWLIKLGLEQDLVQSIIGWQSADMISIYNDATAKDRKWKGLDKLKNALEQDNQNNSNQNID